MVILFHSRGDSKMQSPPTRKARKVAGDAHHPEGIRGIRDRFLPRVEMTKIPSTAFLREIFSFDAVREYS
ncbi:MAG: hypothetical protein ACXW4Z_21110, partial [Candidatus Binatia bacterium]